MSIKDKQEEAEAILDSAEMLVETYGGRGKTVTELKKKIAELQQEVQDPDSEASLKKLINKIKELMDEVQEDPSDDVMMDEGMGPEPMGPEDDEIPPF